MGLGGAFLRRSSAGALLLFAAAAAPVGAEQDPVRRGEYLLRAGGCVSCHTPKKGSGAFLAGGRALKTDFGTFYGPNLTPDPVTGLGRWTEADFSRALRFGRSPDGRHYFPSFPYPSFTRIVDEDAKAIWAYLQTVPPVSRRNTPHELKILFRWRFLVGLWKLLYFTPGPFSADPSQNADVERGRYLAEALGHCGECHTPRTMLGGLKRNLQLAGNRYGPEGERVPNITPDPETGIGTWSVSDITELLSSGMAPDGDFAGGSMGEVVDEDTSHLTDADRLSIARFLKSLPAVRNDAARRERAERKRRESEW